MRTILGLFLLIFLGAVGIFAAQNTSYVQVRFLGWVVSSPLALLVVVVYLLGMLSGWNVVAFLRRSLRSVATAPRSR
ncbi:MAG TPA: lipopolysaccharide assembly protein LapA domain-containing protein [Isosphaeraceae bacterium]|jgi:uncharacterized integral membrane protein|nr:lipopolysaccharide assembly protein LapA domain-containing protein [Isosphaeraceae bacterium]